MTSTYIGRPMTRKEDVRFITGRGKYTDDFKFQHLLHAAILRSPHPHARILSIDASKAREIPGVEAVFTSHDIAGSIGLRHITFRMAPLPGLERFLQYPIAHDKVRYVGEPVAVVVASSRYVAEDACDAIDVRYEPLPAVHDVASSAADNSLLHEDNGTNQAAHYSRVHGDPDKAFQDAEYTRKETFRSHRHTANPLETRGLTASYDPGRDQLHMYGMTKVPHFNRNVLSGLLDMPEHRIHFIEGDKGGGFGVTGEFYPEDFLIPFASIKLGKPIKWIEDRREHLMSANHSRQHQCELEIATTKDGVILGLRAKVSSDIGAYVRTHGGLVTAVLVGALTGPYRIENYGWEASYQVTNKVSVGTYRAPGQYEAAFFRERLLDMAAQDLSIDPAEFRRRNLVHASEMPYNAGDLRPPGFPTIIYDSGDYHESLRLGLEAINYEGLKEQQGQLVDGKYHGVGLACFVESTGTGPPTEPARVYVSGPKDVAVHIGLTTLGQGHETIMAQICADGLGVPIEYITIYHGDTDLLPFGGGTFASRGTVMTGNAVYSGAQQLKQRVLEISGGYLDVPPEQLEFVDGEVHRVGSTLEGALLDLGQVLELAGPNSQYNQGEIGLDVMAYHRLQGIPFAYGMHAAHVAVDPETGKTDVLNYVVVEDVGTPINPLLVHGQSVGAAVQGIGGTLLEELAYDENGQPLATTFMDYLLPTSIEVPNLQSLELNVAPSPHNPLGVKGAGEGGIVSTGATLANAVSNALSSFGVQVRDLPLSPSRLRELMRGNK